jgi:hypothetical protein
MQVTCKLTIILLFSILSLMFSYLKSPIPKAAFCRNVLQSTSSKSAYSLLMDTPIVLRGLSDIANRYDLFLFDQFGVLHNGVEPIGGICMLYIPSHEYLFLMDSILYLCLSGWFCISMEIDFVTLCHVVIFIK